MPTTNEEAKQISDIVLKYIDKKQCANLFHDLLEVAYSTDNYSLRKSLFMMMKLFDPSFKINRKFAEEKEKEWNSNVYGTEELELHEYIGFPSYEDFLVYNYGDDLS